VAILARIAGAPPLTTSSTFKQVGVYNLVASPRPGAEAFCQRLFAAARDVTVFPFHSHVTDNRGHRSIHARPSHFPYAMVCRRFSAERRAF